MEILWDQSALHLVLSTLEIPTSDQNQGSLPETLHHLDLGNCEQLAVPAIEETLPGELPQGSQRGWKNRSQKPGIERGKAGRGPSVLSIHEVSLSIHG